MSTRPSRQSMEKLRRNASHIREEISVTSGGANLRKICFLIHPLTYAPECADTYRSKEFYKVSRECENSVRRRYHEAIDKMGKDEALVIYPSVYPIYPQELVDIEVMARRKLGQRLVICGYPTTSAEFINLARKQSLRYDPQTVDTEGWGESFDGCVAKHCAIISKQLGLTKPIEQNFAMCVPDSILLFKTKFIEKVTLPSKIRFYLFEMEGGRPLAVFFEPYLTTGDQLRRVDIPLTPDKAETYQYLYDAVLTPAGLTKIVTPDGKGVRLPICTDLADPPQRGYIAGKDVDIVTFRAAMVNAKVVE